MQNLPPSAPKAIKPLVAQPLPSSSSRTEHSTSSLLWCWIDGWMDGCSFSSGPRSTTNSASFGDDPGAYTYSSPISLAPPVDILGINCNQWYFTPCHTCWLSRNLLAITLSTTLLPTPYVCIYENLNGKVAQSMSSLFFSRLRPLYPGQ